jgi:hypothetical protein
MKRFNLLGLCALAACAMALVALPVSSASAAAKKVLQLDEGETKAANNAPGTIVVFIDTCEVKSGGTLSGNDAATIKLKATPTSTECNEAVTESGSITEASMTATKKLTMKGSITVGEAGCNYTFTKWSTTFAIPGPVAKGGLKVTGKLAKGSAKGCAKTLTELVTIAVVHPIAEEPESTEPFDAVLTT